MRVAVLHPQTAFVRGGAETHAESLVKALKAAGHDADLVQIAGKWYPPSQLAHQMAVWRSFDITESNGLKVDAVIGLKFPAYLAQHERKMVWLIHQHRTAYELWDHPDYADLKRQDDGAAVRDMVWEADRVALGEAKRVFTNSYNVKDRLWNSLRIPAETLYHPSGVSERLLDREPGPLRRAHPVPQPHGVAEAAVARDRRDEAREDAGAARARRPWPGRARSSANRSSGSGSAIASRFEIGVSDERLEQLYLSALGVYFGPFDEDYGYVTLEGMAAERPVVTLTDSGGPLEFVRDDETGHRRPAGAAGDRRGVRPAAPSTGRRPRGWARPGNALDPRRGAALARRRRAAAGLMGARAKAAGVSRRLRSPKAVQVEHGTGPGSAGELVFCGPLPPAPTGIATYDRAVLDGLERIGFNERHRMDVLWPIEPRDAIRFPGYHLGIFQLGNNVEFHLEIYRAAFLTSALIVLHDLALDDFVRGLKTAGDPLGFMAAREAGRLRGNLTSPDVIRNEPLREPWAAHVARRARGIIVHSAFCKALPGGSRLPHAGLRGAASGRGVAAGVRAGRGAGSRPCAPRWKRAASAI